MCHNSIRSLDKLVSKTMDSLVWAKMRFCPYWPAKLVQTPPELGPTPKNKVCVLFMATKQFGFIPRDKIESYTENRERFIKKGKGIDFRTAVQHMDEYISDSVKFRSHAYVKAKTKKIKIKTEQDVERQLGIKVERTNEYEPNTNESGDKNIPSSAQASASDSWADEKKSLIDNFMALKSENQLLVQQLNDKNAELNSANALKRELKIRTDENDLEFATKMNELKKELVNATKKEAASAKIISDLKRENSLLLSQNKQLQSGLAQGEESNSDSEDEGDVYEVESLLDDKLVTERHYLVRWKGFDATEDSWERESNLRCENILKKYKQLKKN